MQASIEQAIERVTGHRASLLASGRTDAGAHAVQQVIAFSTESELPAATIQRALNAHLADDIAVTASMDVAPDFHPRFDAVSRVYRYLIWNRPTRSPFWRGRAAHVKQALDASAMHAAAQVLFGPHDFGAFVATHADSNRERTMYRAECSREGDLVGVELEASGFMRQMVRAIVGTLVQVGLGAIDRAALSTILESKDRGMAGETVPACGLYLVAVKYISLADHELSSERSSLMPAFATPLVN